MSNLIRVYDPTKGWVKPSERTTLYRTPVVDPPIVLAPVRHLKREEIVECKKCRTGNLIIKGKPCGVCEALKKVAA